MRTKELAAIHVAAKALALHDDSYRALIARFTAGRTESAGAMTAAERSRLLDHLRSIGFKPKQGRRRDPRPQAAKARALWLSLWQLGALRDPSEAALGSFVERHTGVAALQFADGEKLNRVIEHLKEWCGRIGYHESGEHADWNVALINAQWDRLIALGALKNGVFARLDTWLHHQGFHVAAPQFLTEPEQHRVIDRLGQWLRRVAPKEEA
jgi:phage gp16-like protein